MARNIHIHSPIHMSVDDKRNVPSTEDAEVSPEQDMYNTLDQVNRIHDELEMKLRQVDAGQKLEPEEKRTMKQKAQRLDTLLPLARQYEAATGGDVLENARQTLEQAKKILGMAI